MAVKKTLEEVNKVFISRGCVLKSTEYKNNKSELWFICPKGHLDRTCLSDFIKAKVPCSYCSNNKAGYGNDLGTLFPEIAKEFDPDFNYPYSPCDFVPGSHTKVWWRHICADGCVHRWEASIVSRTSTGHCCPYCSNQRVGYGNDLATRYPEVALLWHKTKNERGPESYFPSSHKKVWWQHIANDGQVHEWEAVISSMVLSSTLGCPFCDNKRVGYGNDLATLFPEIAAEWHPTKNEKGPECYTPGSEAMVWWQHCADNGEAHEWQAPIYRRVSGNSTCPFCSNRKIGYGNDLKSQCPELVKEWHPTKNGAGPECYFPGSGDKVWWQHTTDSGEVHEWEAAIYHRAGNGRNCPQCAPGPVSKIANEWLDSLGVPNLYRETREFSIKIGDKTFVVDGYDSETNTVLEFLGDLWHGNPELFSSDYINPVNKKLAGEVYQETISRLESIKQAGYNLVYIWEKDFRLQQSMAGKKKTNRTKKISSKKV